MERSVALADEARRRFVDEAYRAGRSPEPRFVAASIGPYGAILADGSEYRGDYGLGRAELTAWHRQRFEILSLAGPDLLAIETIPTVDEGAALVDLLTAGDGPPAWLSFTCADGARTRRGEPVEEAFALAEASDRVVAIGINCTAPRAVDELIGRARAVTGKPIVVYPNNGETWDATSRRWRPSGEPDVDGAAALRWLDLGAQLLGGCCRVGPARIAEIAAAIG
jgi:homocysteine S-methyltransferase